MTELTDLEICKKIAEIEGILVEVVEHSLGNPWAKTKIGTRYNYNPLIDKTLLWDLMVKYQVCIEFETAEHGIVEIWPLDAEVSALIGTYSSVFYSSEGLPRAILQCIIDANSK